MLGGMATFFYTFAGNYENTKAMRCNLFVCGLAVSWMGLAAVLSGCERIKQKSTEAYVRSDYYTRGIGCYPGLPQEDFSPELRPDDKSYRNVALHRMAYQSSAYDYNLTAQLLTDGMLATENPCYLTVSTAKGDLPRREREWALDRGPYSYNEVWGADAYLQFSTHQYAEQVDGLRLQGRVAYREDVRSAGYELVLMGSDDGVNWTELGVCRGSGMPGRESRYRMHSDPNKQSDSGTLPSRVLDEAFTLHHVAAKAHYRVCLRWEAAACWRVNAADFSCRGERVDLRPTGRFVSAWMSAGTWQEWVYVDLGGRATFDKVVLHWVRKASVGKVQVSDDAVQWRDLASLPGGDALCDVVDVKGQGRYVRVWMDQSADGGRFVLSELEVMGRGGVVAHPMAQPASSDARTIRLSGGNWRLQRASEVRASGEEIASKAFRPEGWIVATVPATVLTSYCRIGALPDPNYADNQLLVSESFFWSDFWYRNEFDIPDTFRQERLFLRLDGINWKANVYMNGSRLGRVEGAFKQEVFDVTEVAVAGRNVLAVEIIRNSHIGSVKEKNEQSTDFNGGILGADNPTFHATIGWDWIPTVRGRNMGIWNDVSIFTTGAVTLESPYVQTQLALPDTTRAELRAEVCLKNRASTAVSGVLKGRVGEIDFEQPVTLQAGAETKVAFAPEAFPQLRMENPRLWWPVGYGSPHLYDASFAFHTNGTVSDTCSFRVGVRQMTYSEENQVLNMYINGRRFIGRGGNWGFSESNLNYRGREYETAVAYHADMHFNIIRNWVGMVGDEELYEACDKYGILLWQDFWLANPADGPDPDDPAMFLDNAENLLKRIRHHACVGLYCGRNEGFPPPVLDKGLRKLVAQWHPDLHYIPSSADEVVSGHGPYRMLPAKTYFTLETGNDRFHSERGMPNVLTYESMLRTFSAKGIWPQADEWGMHDYTREGAQGATSFNEIIAEGYGEPQTAQEFAELAQWVNYDGHRSLFESRSKNRMGLLMWMSHPCWPSMVWQTYDYYLEPTAAYFGIKKACEPLHIQWNPASEEVEVVNYSAGLHRGLKARAEVRQLDGTLAWSEEVVVDSREDSTMPCIRLAYPSSLSDVHFLKLTLWEQGRVVSDNFYHRSVKENDYRALRSLPHVRLEKETCCEQASDGTWSARVRLTNRSKVPALLVRLNLTGKEDHRQILPVWYEDNYFSLLPGEEKTIRLHWYDRDTRGCRPEVVVSGYNVEADGR